MVSAPGASLCAYTARMHVPCDAVVTPIARLPITTYSADTAPVLPLANQKGGHRLGVNGLAVDTESSILYVLHSAQHSRALSPMLTTA